jgi:uncharacterized protein YbjT (DUF2867 family)
MSDSEPEHAPLIAVSGATGHVGAELCRLLLAGGARERALGREAARLKAIGADEPALGSLDDTMGLKKALAGATAIFAMIPPNLASGDFRAYARRIIDAFMQAIPASGATHVVALSSIGADLDAGNGPIAALHELETRLAQLGINVLALRPAFFLENHLAGARFVKHRGVYGTPLRPDVALPMIATRDIAAVAAKRLLARDFTGSSVLELHGAKEYTMADVARTLGKEIGRPDLAYAQFPYDEAQQAMVGMGMSTDMARLYIEMNRGFNDGVIKPSQPRTAQTTTPTTLGQFAKQFAAAYKGAN